MRRLLAPLLLSLLTAALSLPISTAPAQATAGPVVGVNAHYDWTSYTDAQRLASLDKMRSANLGWVRIDLDWAWVQPNGPSDWTADVIARMDYSVNAAIARGFKVLVSTKGTPFWACGCSDHRAPPTVAATFGTYLGKAASYFKGRVAAWEIWNEPNPPASQAFFTGTAAQYAGLVRASYAPIKAADPSALVVAGSTVYNDDGWLALVYASGLHGYFDVISTHPYQGVANQPPNAADDGSIYHLTHVSAVHDLMTSYGDGAKPIWFTEFGWSNHANTGGEQNWQLGVSDQQQADYFTQTITLVANSWSYVPVIMWYEDREETSGNPQLDHYGLLTPSLGDKLVYTALVQFMGTACTITGTAGNDTLNGTAGADVICGLGGNDVISASAGGDTIYGGDGDDWIAPGAGANTVDGGPGSDTVSYTTVSSGVTLNLATGTASGADVSDSLAGFEKASGSPAADTLTGDGSANYLAGLGGDDTLNGAAGDDQLLGGPGNDQVNGGDGADYLMPGGGADVVNGGAGVDTVSYLDITTGGVTVNVGSGQASGAGQDALASVENAAGTNQADVLTGSAGSNSLYGWAGNDSLYGLDGSDWLNGGDGVDTCFDPQGATYANCEA